MSEIKLQPISIEEAMRIAQVHYDAGQLPEAEQVYRQILKIDSGTPDAHFGLADTLSELGKFEEAEQGYRRGISLDPRRAIPRFNLGNALRGLGRLEEAAHSYRDAIALKPDFADALYNLANTLAELGRHEEADTAYRQVLALNPAHVEAHNNRGTVLSDLGRLDEAAGCYRAALALRPEHAVAYNNLGNVLRELGRHEEAEPLYRRTVELKPGLAEAWTHHGNALLDLGRLHEAERCYRRAIELTPGLARARSNLLLLLNYLPDLPPGAMSDAAREFGLEFDRVATAAEHRRRGSPATRLRIGYLSGDFRTHSVAFFIESVFEWHDRGRFEIFCYHNFPRADGVTRRLKARGDAWRDTWAMNDQALYDCISGDAIDILVDLSGHTANNRLPVLGRKPAPVQVTYLGCPSTTGLSAIDYRLTDGIADPPGESGSAHVERLIRLPHPMWCFSPDPQMPEPGPLPARRAGVVTLGSFNYFAKLNAEVLALWADLLARIPGSRLIVTRIPGEEAAARVRVAFEKAEIAPDRLELHGILPRQRLLELLERTDIALDPFPYSGTTTTCDVLWAGIPVVTLAGETTAARSGASLLQAVGLGSLVASTKDRYLEIARTLALDMGALAELRAGMRARMRSSRLTDGARFTRDLEGAYRFMWGTWCQGRAA